MDQQSRVKPPMSHLPLYATQTFYSLVFFLCVGMWTPGAQDLTLLWALLREQLIQGHNCPSSLAHFEGP